MGVDTRGKLKGYVKPEEILNFKGRIDMKVKMDKNAITLADLPEANKLRKEYQGYGKNTIDLLIRTAIKANTNKLDPEHPYSALERIISIDKIEVTKNHGNLTVWIYCIVKMDSDIIVRVYFDAQQAICHLIDSNDSVDAFAQIYDCRK